MSRVTSVAQKGSAELEKEYSISESEWEVMKVLWKNPNRTMSFIVEQLEGETDG